MWFLSLVACSTQEKAPETPPVAAEVEVEPQAPVPAATDGEVPGADAVLQRFLDASKQCDVLTADSYRMVWQAITTDNKMIAMQEKVMQQGRQGVSFTRLHERTRPDWGLSVIGRTPEGDYWSGTNQGIVHKILDPTLQAQMMQSLDPTPACNFEKRWPTRVNQGSEDYEGTPAWKLLLTWADGTATQAWFSKDDGLLLGMLTQREGYELRHGMSDYAEVGGVFWPKEEKSREQRGENVLISVRRLHQLSLGQPIPTIGPDEVEAMLAQKVADGELKRLGPEKNGG